MTDYPSLQPALHMRIKIGPPLLVGALTRATPLTVVPIVQGTITSDPSFGIPIDWTLKDEGKDYVRNDPDGRRMRLDADAVFA